KTFISTQGSDSNYSDVEGLLEQWIVQIVTSSELYHFFVWNIQDKFDELKKLQKLQSFQWIEHILFHQTTVLTIIAAECLKSSIVLVVFIWADLSQTLLRSFLVLGVQLVRFEEISEDVWPYADIVIPSTDVHHSTMNETFHFRNTGIAVVNVLIQRYIIHLEIFPAFVQCRE
ncbi:AAEL014877-PA, partial [Aedes aegypti]